MGNTRICATVVDSVVAVGGMSVAVGVGAIVGVGGIGVGVLATASAIVGEIAVPLVSGARADDAVGCDLTVPDNSLVVVLSAALDDFELVAVGIANAGAGGNAGTEDAADEDAAAEAAPAAGATLVGLGALVGAA